MATTTTARGRSVPPPKPQPDSTCGSISAPVNVNAPTTLPSGLPSAVQPPSTTSSTSQGAGRFVTRAEALAKMTYELNMRAVNVQTDRLERDVKALAQSTSEDRAFRAEHEARLESLWREVEVVKHRMTGVDGDDDDDDEGQEKKKKKKKQQLGSDMKAVFEQCQLETKSLIAECQGEIQDLKTLVDELSKQVDELPHETDSPNDSGYKSQSAKSMEQDDSLETKREDSLNSQHGWDAKTESYVHELVSLGHDADAVAKASRRVVEAVKSTRRWNHDYKKTKLSDAAFTADYLKRQSKRDAPLAVHIQKSILRALRRRNTRLAYHHPRSLEQFCQHVKWQDVMDTVQSVLVENMKNTIVDLLSAD